MLRSSQPPDPLPTHAPLVAQVVVLPRQGKLDVLDYAIPPQLRSSIVPGMRVIVPLGKRYVMAVVVSLAAHSQVTGLRPLASVIDETRPILDPSLLALCRWLAEYYLGSLTDAVATALPGPLRIRVSHEVCLATPDMAASAEPAQRAFLDQLLPHLPASLEELRKRFPRSAFSEISKLREQGILGVRERFRAEPRRFLPGERRYRAVSSAAANDHALLRRSPALRALYDYVRVHPLGAATHEELVATFPNAEAKLRRLLREGLIQRDHHWQSPMEDGSRAIPPLVWQLDEAQQAAFERIESALGGGFRPFLLWGVTGSGKTEVYLRAAQACLERGQSTLILVPEISLTHQLVAHLRARFGNQVAVLHSGLSDSERWREWQRVSTESVRVVAGARSAVFAPVPQLGLVIVDEEHDPAYKQEEGLRYHARDVAVMRAKLTGCPVVLVSATPSLESFYNARTGKYTLLYLPQRVQARPLPKVELVDLRGQRVAERALPLSRQLVSALRANHAAGHQSLLFLNRRGFARFLQCVQCGAGFSCPNCSVSLTYHRGRAALRCHYCNFSRPAPQSCPNCGFAEIAAWGAGTEHLETQLRRLLPGAHIARLDRDIAARRGAMASVLAQWEAGRHDVLVGTQMIAKGHDVHGVTLVGVLAADLSLQLPDFRASERTFQLLAQVAGRAGRGEHPGRVLVQTFSPEHPVLRFAAGHDYAGFAEVELALRKEALYPPFARLVLVRCEAQRCELARRVAGEVASAIRGKANEQVELLGPSPAPIERLRGWYRWQLLLRSRDGTSARRVAREVVESARTRAERLKVRIVVDVDPQSTL